MFALFLSISFSYFYSPSHTQTDSLFLYVQYRRFIMWRNFMLWNLSYNSSNNAYMLYCYTDKQENIKTNERVQVLRTTYNIMCGTFLYYWDVSVCSQSIDPYFLTYNMQHVILRCRETCNILSRYIRPFHTNSLHNSRNVRSQVQTYMLNTDFFEILLFQIDRFFPIKKFICWSLIGSSWIIRHNCLFNNLNLNNVLRAWNSNFFLKKSNVNNPISNALINFLNLKNG